MSTLFSFMRTSFSMTKFSQCWLVHVQVCLTFRQTSINLACQLIFHLCVHLLQAHVKMCQSKLAGARANERAALDLFSHILVGACQLEHQVQDLFDAGSSLPNQKVQLKTISKLQTSLRILAKAIQPCVPVPWPPLVVVRNSLHATSQIQGLCSCSHSIFTLVVVFHGFTRP